VKYFDDIAAVQDNKYRTDVVDGLIEVNRKRGGAAINHSIGRWRRPLDMDARCQCASRQDKHARKRQPGYYESPQNHDLRCLPWRQSAG